MTKYAHGLELTAPNSVPVSPASSPSSEYTIANPDTYASVIKRSPPPRALRRPPPLPGSRP